MLLRYLIDIIQPMVDIEDALGQRIGEAVKTCGKKPADVAEFVGITEQSLYKSFQTGGLRLKNFIALLEVTGADANYVLLGDKSTHISEAHEPYKTRHNDLHALIDQLSPTHAEQMFLSAKTMVLSNETNVEVKLSIENKNSEETNNTSCSCREKI